jgi:hypothetical protein
VEETISLLLIVEKLPPRLIEVDVFSDYFTFMATSDDLLTNKETSG